MLARFSSIDYLLSKREAETLIPFPAYIYEWIIELSVVANKAYSERSEIIDGKVAETGRV